MTTCRKQRRGVMLLTTVVVALTWTVAEVKAVPVDQPLQQQQQQQQEGRAIGQEEGTLGGWLLNWAVNRPEGDEMDLSELEMLVEEGRRRKVDGDPSPSKPIKNRKSKNNKREEGTPASQGYGTPVETSGHYTPVAQSATAGTPLWVGDVPITYDVPTKPTTTSYTTNSWYDYITNFLPDFSLSSSFDASISQGAGGTGSYTEEKPEVWPVDEVEEEVEDVGYNHHHYGRPKPTTTEVLVLRYPDIVKTFAQGVSAWNKVWQAFGLGMTKTLADQFSNTKIPTAVGSGVMSVIPLDHQDDPYNTGGELKPPLQYLPQIPTFPNPILNLDQLNQYLPAAPTFGAIPDLSYLLPSVQSNAQFALSNSGHVSVGGNKPASTSSVGTYNYGSARDAEGTNLEANNVSYN